MTKSAVQMLLELLHAWCHYHHPEEFIPWTRHPLSEEPFLNVHVNFPWCEETVFLLSWGNCSQPLSILMSHWWTHSTWSLPFLRWVEGVPKT